MTGPHRLAKSPLAYLAGGAALSFLSLRLGPPPDGAGALPPAVGAGVLLAGEALVAWGTAGLWRRSRAFGGLAVLIELHYLLQTPYGLRGTQAAQAVVGAVGQGAAGAQGFLARITHATQKRG